MTDFQALMEKITLLEQEKKIMLDTLKDIGEYTGEGSAYTTPWQNIVADIGQQARDAVSKVSK